MLTTGTCPLPVHSFTLYIPSTHLNTALLPYDSLSFSFLTKLYAHFSFHSSTCLNHLVTTYNKVYGNNLLTITKALPSAAWGHFINSDT